jgi:DNA-binding CsgD family transcriptional regulator
MQTPTFPQAAAAVVGRREEILRLREFVEDADPGASRALVLEGPAGIGKSTLWAATVALAEEHGHRVLSCAPVERERQLSFAALADLISPVLDEALPALPAPQRHALRVALLLEAPVGDPPGVRAIALAVLAMLREAAGRSPLLLAVDDEPALDESSRAALDYVVRRLDEPGVRVLATRRGVGERAPLGLDDRTPRLAVAPLSIGDVHELLVRRLDHGFPRPVIRRLHDVSGGNPLYALELGRALASQLESLGPDQPLPVPNSLGALIEARFVALPDPVRALLELVAALFDPRAPLVAALAKEDGLDGAIDEAVAAGVLREAGGRLRIGHPLLSAAVYGQMGPERRRRLHARLGDGGEPGDEARALHLGLSTLGPDARIADELSSAARRSRARGAPATAAQIMEASARLTPQADADSGGLRSVAAAEYWIAAGDHGRARTLLLESLDAVGPGRARGAILFSLAWTPSEQQTLADAADFAIKALEEWRGDADLEAQIRIGVALFERSRGLLAEAEEQARLALDAAERGGVGQTRDLALCVLGEATVMRQGRPTEEARRALALEPVWGVGPTQGRAMLVVAITLLDLGDLEGARRRLEPMVDLATKAGHEPRLGAVFAQLAEVERRSGSWERAARFSDESRELAEQVMHSRGMTAALLPGALLDAAVGREEEGRAAATEGLAIAEALGDQLAAVGHRAVLGSIELAHGEYEAARAQLGPAADTIIRLGVRAPGLLGVVLDDAEAALTCGEVERAMHCLAYLEQAGGGDDWSLAAVLRIQGLVAARRGDVDAAANLLGRAVAAGEAAAQPFELARSLLVLGSTERRRKQKRASRELLERAAELFRELPAPAWLLRVEAELARLGQGVEDDALTETEARIAELAAMGMSNPRIAAEVFVSRKTVEANLSKVYRKLGVSSRVELARRLPR